MEGWKKGLLWRGHSRCKGSEVDTEWTPGRVREESKFGAAEGTLCTFEGQA